MDELHGWFGLSDSPYVSDTSRLNPLIDELHTLRASFKWTNVHVALLPLNGVYFHLVLSPRPTIKD